MAIGTEKRNLSEISLVEAVTMNHALSEATSEFVKNLFKVAKAANVKEYDIIEMAAHAMTHTVSDPMFWDCVAPSIREEIEEEDDG